jgi:hypothetical protein
MADTVRLTVQIRDHSNKTRLTRHEDVPLSQVAARASKVATRLARFYSDDARERVGSNGHKE